MIWNGHKISCPEVTLFFQIDGGMVRKNGDGSVTIWTKTLYKSSCQIDKEFLKEIELVGGVNEIISKIIKLKDSSFQAKAKHC